MDFINFTNIIYRIFIIIIIINKYLSLDLNLNYPHVLSLSNGNVFNIHEKGAIVYNYNFTIPLYDDNFGGNIIISSELENELTSVIQCEDDNKQYVLALIYNKIYIFTNQGQYLFKLENFYNNFINLTNLSVENSVYKGYSFFYYKNVNQIYYFVIEFINNSNAIIAIKLGINMNTKSIESINDKILKENNVFSSACNFGESNNSSKILVCFSKLENSANLLVSLFDIDNNFLKINETSYSTIYLSKSETLFKSSNTNKDKGKIFACYSSGTYACVFCDIKSNEVEVLYGPNCLDETKIITVDYFKHSNQYIYSCKTDSGIAFEIFNEDADSHFDQVSFGCTDFNYFSMILLPFESKYIVFSKPLCEEENVEINSFPSYLLPDVDMGSNNPDSNALNSTYDSELSKTTIIYTTIITTIPNPVETTILTTILEPSFTSIYYTNEATIPTTLLTQIPTTIPPSILTQISTTIPPSILTQIPTTIPSTFLNIIPSTSPKFIENIKCKIKCLICNEDSSILNLCIKCNTIEKYFPSNVIGYDFVECYNEETKPINYFFNNITQYYEPCYRNCKTCNYKGDDDRNNCTSCKNNYIFRPDEINSSNCVLKCQYYYYISYGQYFCTENNQCPSEAPFLIRDKGICIDNCFSDNEYKYQFNYECYKECPEDSVKDGDYICRIENKKKCYLYNDFFFNVNYKDLESNHFDNLVKRYIKGFSDTDFHIDFYQSQNYTITIYKAMECLKELEMISTIIDFGECYTKVQEKNNLIGRNLIILISDFFNDKKLVNTLFYFFDPDSGKELSIDEICKDDNFTIEKSLTYYSDINIEQVKFFGNQDINIFNSSDVFYNDLCYHFDSPNKRDVPLKERILLFYPNVTLCDDSCNNVGVNLTTMKAICKCKLKELLDETKDASRLVGLDFAGVIDSLSIDVLKCYKTVFQRKYFIKCYGAFLCILLIFVQSICVFIVGNISIYNIRKTTFSLVDKYISLLKSQKVSKFPPKKTHKNSKSSLIINDNIINSSNEMKYKGTQLSYKQSLKPQKGLYNDNIINYKQSNKKKNSNESKNKVNSSGFQINEDINLKNYLITSMNELDYDDLLIRENRSFCRIFIDKLLVGQMIVDLFFNNNWIIPKSIKIIFIIVMIDLHLVVNALFYNEEYIRDLYFLDKKETLFSFFPRSLNRIIYTSVTSSVLDFIISLLFPTENKIKRILIRKKNNIKEMKNKVFISMKNIINNYWIFIIISYIITIFSWYYISCFNNVYPYLKMEWIKSSVLIIIVIQFISILKCFLFALLRIISTKCKSEKIFRISKYFFN